VVRNNPENYVLFVIEKEMPKDVDESWAKAERSAKNVNIAFLSDSFLSFADNNSNLILQINFLKFGFRLWT